MGSSGYAAVIFDSESRHLIRAHFLWVNPLIILGKSGILNTIAGRMAAQGKGMWALGRKRRRLAAPVLALAVLLCACSTLPQETQPHTSSSAPADVSHAPVQQGPFSISYSNEDTLDPYNTKSRVNLDLATLLFDSLTALDDGFEPRMRVAASVTQTDPTHWTAVLREDAVYSDGSKVTAEDVAASFDLAKNSANYKETVVNIQSAAAAENSVVFTLASPDPNTAACLTFPILKGGAGTTEAGKAPVGGGLYVYTEGDPATLTANPKSGKTLSIPTIRLQHLPNIDAMMHGLDNGTISYYFSDLADGQIPRSGGATLQVSMNYLVFLGINSHKTELNTPAVRKALSDALNRAQLCETAFSGWAQPAVTPFHPMWKPVVEIKGFSSGENLSEAVAQLEAAGYNTKSEAVSSGTAGKDLSLELLYPTGNDFRRAAAETIEQQLEQTGVQLTLVPLEFAEYQSRIRAGNFDIYLGEIRLTGDMNLRPLLASGGAAAYGGAADGEAAKAYQAYLTGEQQLSEFIETFLQDIPYIPLCWRSGVAAYSRSMSQITPTAFDVYYGIENWSLSG